MSILEMPDLINTLDSETKQKKENYMQKYKDIADKIFKPDSTEVEHYAYNMAKFDIFSNDTDKAMACFKTFNDPSDLFAIEEIIRQTNNEEVKLELAKLMNPVENINHLVNYPQHSPETDNEEPEYMGIEDIKFHVDAHRKSIKSMIEHSSGEAIELFKKKLQNFEDAVKTLE